jgi:endonuclease-3
MSKLNQIFTYLKKLFPNPNTELVYNNQFQLMVSVILSAQNTDIQVNKITSKLFKSIKTPQNILQI